MLNCSARLCHFRIVRKSCPQPRGHGPAGTVAILVLRTAEQKGGAHWGTAPYSSPKPTRDTLLCEPAQSKRTWTFQNSHFVWKFTGKMKHAPASTSIKHRALTVAIRTPQCGHTVWGTKILVSHMQLSKLETCST